MRILGVDPGLQISGFGVIDAEGGALQYVASGTVRTAAAPRHDLPGRLKLLHDGLREVVTRYGPQAACVEIVFVNVNPQATLLLGQARGACVTALVAAGLPVAEVTALQMKKAVAGYGKATKAEVQEMVKRLLRLPATPGPDAADALGLAIAHAHLAGARARLADAIGGAAAGPVAGAPRGPAPGRSSTQADYKAGRMR